VTVGSTFWVHGNFWRWPALRKKADTVELGGDDGMPCQMLFVFQGVSYCYIEMTYGREAKPQVCRDHPEEGLCQHEKLFE